MHALSHDRRGWAVISYHLSSRSSGLVLLQCDCSITSIELLVGERRRALRRGRRSLREADAAIPLEEVTTVSQMLQTSLDSLFS